MSDFFLKYDWSIFLESPAKRQKKNIGSVLFEVEATRQARFNTFSHWLHPSIFCLRMIEAGFFGCNNNDRVICIYCNLICHQWDIESDDPCEVHRTLAPHCPFVKSMTCYHSLQYNKITSTLPRHKDYVDPQSRLQSFSSWLSRESTLVDKLVDAGFFCDGSNIVCFYCDGTFDSWKSNNYPIAEHVRCFPNCNYARQLCGEGLYHQIQQQSLKSKHGLVNIRHPLREIDLSVLSKWAVESLDLPISQRLLQRGEFDRSIIVQCWMDQLQFKRKKQRKKTSVFFYSNFYSFR